MKRLFTLILLLFCFGFAQDLKAQILWERIEKDTVTYRDQYRKILIKDSLIYLSGTGTWINGTDDKTFYACYNTNGRLKWRKNGRDSYYFYSDVILDTDSTLVTYRYNNNWFKLDFMRIRMATGDTLPPRQFTVPYAMKSIPYGYMVKEPNGSYVIGAGGVESHLAKLNSNGQPVWSKTIRWADPLGNTGDIETNGFLRKPNGNYLMCATRNFRSPGSYSGHPILIEFNANGDTVKSKTLVISNPQYYEYLDYSNFIRTRKNEFLFTGIMDTVSSNNVGVGTKYFLTKVDEQYNVKWTYYNKGALSGYMMNFVYELADSSFVALAGVRFGATGNFAIINISKTGQYVSHNTYTSPFCNGLPMLWDWKLLPDGTSIVAGKCKNHGYTYLARLASVGAPAVLSDTEEIESTSNYLADAYPNPVTESVTFSYNLPAKTKNAELRISEIATGKLVKTLALNTNEKREQFSIKNLSAGLYAYTLLVEGAPVSTKKLVIVK